MPPEIVDASAFSIDVQDFLRALHAHKVRFMIVEGEAVIFYGHIRVTGDIDGVDFESAWRRRTHVELESPARNVPFSYIGLKDLIRNKWASGRPKDADDLPYLLEALT